MVSFEVSNNGQQTDSIKTSFDSISKEWISKNNLPLEL